jgi:hypothetical protein
MALLQELFSHPENAELWKRQCVVKRVFMVELGEQASFCCSKYLQMVLFYLEN